MNASAMRIAAQGNSAQKVRPFACGEAETKGAQLATEIVCDDRNVSGATLLANGAWHGFGKRSEIFPCWTSRKIRRGLGANGTMVTAIYFVELGYSATSLQHNDRRPSPARHAEFGDS